MNTNSLYLSTPKTEKDALQLLDNAIKRSNDIKRIGKSGAATFFNATFNKENADQDRMWQFYVENIRSFVTAGHPADNLQIATSLNPVRWLDVDYGSYYFHVESADKMPEVGPNYIKTSNSFYERYYDFMSSINPKPVNEDAFKEAEKIERERRADSIALLDIEYEYGEAWRRFDDRQQLLPPHRRLTSKQWYEQVGADESIQAQRDIINAKEGVYLFWMQQALSPDEPLLRALKKYRDFKRTITVKIPRSSLNPDDKVSEQKGVMPYVLSPDFPAWMKEVPNRSPNVTIKYSSNSSTYDYSRTRISGGAFIGFGFFCAIGAGQRVTKEINISSENFSFEFSTVAEIFSVTPDQWYDSSLFELYQNGPFKDGGPIARAYNENRLFGPNGFINFRPARAIVGYKPKVTLKFSRQDYHYFKQETRGWAAFGVGPFLIGGGGSYHDVRINSTSNDQTGELSLFADDDFPYLLAFDYEDVDPRG